MFPPHLMSGADFITFRGIVDGDSSPFKVSMHRDADVDDLKEAIQKKRKALQDVDADNLVVWMVRVLQVNANILADHCEGKFLFNAEPVEPRNTLLQRIRSQGKVEEFAEMLTGTEQLSTFFPKPPIMDHVYVLVQRPSTILHPIDDSKPLTNAYPRSGAVKALYERLNTHSFIQVRGTPGSGKTVLSRLLAEYIYQQEHDVKVMRISRWPLADKRTGNYESYLKRLGWNPQKNTVFIFDEGQLTYDDEPLWFDFFKSMHDFQECRAIIFASYGSPTSLIEMSGTPMGLSDTQRVTLNSIDHKDGLASVGLLFTKIEFDDLVARRYHSSHFDKSFFDTLFEITNGHIGAIKDFIRIIIVHDSYRELKYSDSQLYTWNLFLAKVSPGELVQMLQHAASIFKRGLPSNIHLQVPATASVFSAVLRDNVVKDADFITDDEVKALQECFRNGWLHADKLGPDHPDDAGYVFPSSLHRWYVEWKLSDTLPPQSFQVDRLLDFVIDVIRLFSPRHLSAARRIGPGSIQRPPEAQYQDEFYRCCHVCSNGSLITFPEYGTANGRVDFYVPAKRWGIELLRNGDQLASHCGRFSKAGSYMTTLSFSDYVIIDCRTTYPEVTHPTMKNLYHAVFTNNFQRVYILDNRLRVVKDGEFQLC